MSKMIKAMIRITLALGLALPAASAPAATRGGGGWNPCAGLRDPLALWACWSAGGGGEGLLAAACVPKSACPPKDQNGKPVLSCYYESDYKTVWRCILFCDYGGAFPWGSDGGNHCD